MAEKLQFLTEILYFKQCLSASILILLYAGPQIQLVLYIFTTDAKINITTNFSSLFFFTSHAERVHKNIFINVISKINTLKIFAYYG